MIIFVIVTYLQKNSFELFSATTIFSVVEKVASIEKLTTNVLFVSDLESNSRPRT